MTGICLLLSFIQTFYKLSLFIFETFCAIDHTFYNNNIFFTILLCTFWMMENPDNHIYYACDVTLSVAYIHTEPA